MRLAHVQAVDDVAAIDEPRRADEHVVGGARRQLPQGRRDRRGGLAAQQAAGVEVARVAALACRAVGRIAQRVVVVGDGDDAVGAVHVDRAAPAGAQGVGRARDELLHAMRPVGGVGEVGQGQGLAQLVLA